MAEGVAGSSQGADVWVLEMLGITKRFPGTVALDGVDLRVARGEIHGLVGQNGAGKSTLMKILAGDYPPTAGTIRLEGETVTIASPREARRLGIGIVYQELSLLPNLSVADNLFLGRELRRGWTLDEAGMRARTSSVLHRMGIDWIEPRALVERLSLSERQLVEVAKVLSLDARLLIFDEPTATLTQSDAERLFQVLRSLKAAGIAVIFISHRYREVLEICDRCTVLRNGRVVDVFDNRRRDLRLEHLVEATLGQRPEVSFQRSRPRSAGNEPAVLSVEHACVGQSVRDVSFEVARGEIFGLCGLLGSGQDVLARALFGDPPLDAGVVRVHGRPVHISSPLAATRLGLGLITESRREEGIFPQLSVLSNISAASLAKMTWGALPVLSRQREDEVGGEAARYVDLASSLLPAAITRLSGGNQQKAIVARWLARDVDVLICLEPTRGVDVGARLEIYRRLDAIAQMGKSVVVVSTDIQEILMLCDRIAVFCAGQIAGLFTREHVDERDILYAMQGQRVA